MLQKSSSKIVMVEKVFSVSIFCLFFFARESLGPWSRLPWGLILHGRSLRLSPTQGQPCKDKISTNTYRSSLFASPVLEDRANQPPSDLAHSIFPNHLDYESQSSFQPTNWLASAVPSRHNHRLNLNFQKKFTQYELYRKNQYHRKSDLSRHPKQKPGLLRRKPMRKINGHKAAHLDKVFSRLVLCVVL